MSHKKFTSRSGWFKLTLPPDWEEYEIDEEDTYAFFNAKDWTGNFRITPFRWANLADPNQDKAAEFILEQLNENEGATRIKLGSFDCALYKENVLQDGDELVIYYWIAGKMENLFICSFTINKNQEQTQQNKVEVKTVEDIIKSIEIT